MYRLLVPLFLPSTVRWAGWIRCLAVLSLLVASEVAAQPVSDGLDEASATLSLSVEGSCVDPSALEANVAELLGRDAFVEGDAELEVRVGFETAADLSARIVIALPDGTALGERRIRIASCDEALGPVALVVAVLADIPRRSLPVAVVEPRPLAATLALAGGVTSGWVPGDASSLFELRVGLREGQFTAELLALYVPEGSASGSEGAVHGWVGLVGISVCGLALIAEPIHLGACAEAGGGITSAWATGLEEVRSSLRPQGMWGMSVRFEWVILEGLALRIEVGARSPLVRDRLRVTPTGGSPEVLFTPPTLAPQGLLGLEARFR